jgi:hypothetical protein
MTRHQNPRELIESCLKPLGLNEHSPATQETVRRLIDAFTSTKPDNGADTRPLEGARAPVIVINEAAHGYDA